MQKKKIYFWNHEKNSVYMGDMQNIFVFQAVDYMSNNLAERLKKIFSPDGLDLSTTDIGPPQFALK